MAGINPRPLHGGGAMCARQVGQILRRQSNRDQSRQNDQDRKKHLGEGRDQRRAACRIHGVRRHGPLDDQKIRAPVSEREHETQPHGQAEPFHAQAVGVRIAHAQPGMRVCGIQIGLQPVPAADVLQAQPDQRKESGDDQEKLDHFVVDGAGQSARAGCIPEPPALKSPGRSEISRSAAGPARRKGASKMCRI